MKKALEGIAHFTNGMKLRDGQPLKVGKTYKYEGELEMCAKGYHASVDIVDALYYAPGFQVSRVECSGDMKKQSDKLVCRNRKVLWTLDAKAIILKWSIRVATDAVKMVRKTSTDKAWNAWADLWISGKDRTYAHAAADAAAANAAANAATPPPPTPPTPPPPTPPTPPRRRRQRRRRRRRQRRRRRRRLRRPRPAAAYAAAHASAAADAARKKYSGWLVAMIEKERGKPW